MGFYSLLTGKLHKKTKKRRLKNFPAGYVGSFYRNLADNADNFIGSDFYRRIPNYSIYRRKTYKNVFLQLLISLRAFKLTSITT